MSDTPMAAGPDTSAPVEVVPGTEGLLRRLVELGEDGRRLTRYQHQHQHECQGQGQSQGQSQDGAPPR